MTNIPFSKHEPAKKSSLNGRRFPGFDEPVDTVGGQDDRKYGASQIFAMNKKSLKEELNGRKVYQLLSPDKDDCHQILFIYPCPPQQDLKAMRHLLDKSW
jgi:hypothetical protein